MPPKDEPPPAATAAAGTPVKAARQQRGEAGTAATAAEAKKGLSAAFSDLLGGGAEGADAAAPAAADPMLSPPGPPPRSASTPAPLPPAGAEAKPAAPQKAKTAGGLSKLKSKFAGLQKVVLSGAPAKVEHANLMARDLAAGITFQPRLLKDAVTGQDSLRVLVIKPAVSVCWDWQKFVRRLEKMEALQKQVQAGGAPPAMAAGNPFWDDDANMLGECVVYLQSLGNMIEHDADIKIVAPTGTAIGTIHIEIMPLDEEGQEGPWEDEREDLDPFVEDAEELAGQDIQFNVKIGKLTLEDPKLWTHCRCRFKVDSKNTREDWTTTGELDPDAQGGGDFRFKKECKVSVDAQFVEHLKHGGLHVQFFATLTDPSGGWQPAAPQANGAG